MSSPPVTMSPPQLPPAGSLPSPPSPLRERWEAAAAARRDERDRPPEQKDADERKRRAEGSEAPPPAIGLAALLLTRSGALASAAGRVQTRAAAAAELAAHQAANAATTAVADAAVSRAGAQLNAAAMASAAVQAAAADARITPIALVDAPSSVGHAVVASATPSALMGVSTAVANSNQPLDRLGADGAQPAGGHRSTAGAGRSAAAEPGRRELAGAAISVGLPPPSAPTTAPASTAAPRPAPDARVFASALEAQAAAAASPAGSRATLIVPMNRLGEGQHVLASWPHGIQGSHVQLRSSNALGHRVLSEALEATNGSDAGPWIVEASGRGDDEGTRRDRASPAPWEED